MDAPDHFERLGLPRRFSIDAAALERAYLARSRELHPDFHHARPAAERHASETLTAALNEAYTTLRDPFRRADYLLALLGGPSAAEDKNQDPAFLMEMMDERERIDEARATGQRLDTIESSLIDRLLGIEHQLGEHLDRTATTADLAAIRRLLNASKTIQSLLRDLRAE